MPALLRSIRAKLLSNQSSFQPRAVTSHYWLSLHPEAEKKNRTRETAQPWADEVKPLECANARHRLNDSHRSYRTGLVASSERRRYTLFLVDAIDGSLSFTAFKAKLGVIAGHALARYTATRVVWHCGGAEFPS